MRKGRWFAGVAVILAGGIGWLAAQPTLTATALILDLTGQGPTIRRFIPIRAQPIRTRDIDVPTRYGGIRARLFEPADPARRPTGTLAVIPGVHAGGIDEPRMNTLAHQLAAHGLRVLIAPLPELRAFVIRPRSTDEVEDVAVWLSAQTDLTPSGRIGLVGVSFSGGLALVAAGRPSLAGKLTLVAAMGTHGDLPRAMRFLCTGELGDGTTLPPHSYGATVILYAGVHHFVPADQVAPLRHAMLTFLNASSLDVTDPARSAALFADARALGDALPEPARTVMGWVNDRDVATFGPKLLPYLEELGGADALSPERSPITTVPVFLLHGAHDNVIPYTETPRLAASLAARGNAQVTVLLTPLISHANVAGAGSRPPIGEVWRLVRFWTSMLHALRAF